MAKIERQQMSMWEKRICKQCGKPLEIFNLADYAWRYGRHYFCGYNCMRKFKYPNGINNEPKILKGAKYTN